MALAFSQAMGAPYHAAVARWPGTPVVDDGGSIVTPGTPVAKDCRVQVDVATEAMRSAEGFKDTDVRLLVLAASLDGLLDTQAQIEVTEGPNAGVYSLQSASTDPAGIAWDCRGRRERQASNQPIIRYLSGGITGDAGLFAVLSISAPLAGTVAGSSMIAGALDNVPPGMSMLSGAVVGGSLLNGGMDVRAALAGQVAGSGSLVGAFTASALLSGQMPSAGTLAGALSTFAALSGTIAGAGAVTGTLTNTPGTVYDTDAQNYFAAMTVQPDATRKGLINDLFVGLKTDGVWAKPDWLILLASHDAQAARINARTPSKIAAAVNSPTFTVDRGFTGDGATSYIDFGENLSASPNQLAQDSGTVGVWCNQASSTTGSSAHFGQSGSGQRYNFNASATTALFRAGDSTSSIYNNVGTTRTGHRTIVRIDASSKAIFHAGANKQTFVVASTGVGTAAYVLRSNTSYSDDRAAVAYSGAGMSDAQVAALHNRLNTFLTAIGAN